MLYSVFYVVYLALMMIGGAGPFPSFIAFPYMHRSATWYNVNDPGQRIAVIIEALLWVTFLGFAIEEEAQLRQSGVRDYLSSGWNRLDALCILTSFGALIFRAVSLGNLATYGYGYEHDFTSVVEQGYRNLFAISIVLRYCRATELLSYSPYVGEYIDILTLMVAESGPILLIVFIAVITFGVAFSTLELPGNFRPDTLRRPLVEPVWALLGDFSVDDYYDRMGTNIFPVYPILLFVYLFLTTIFLVNLLIAQVAHGAGSGVLAGARVGWVGCGWGQTSGRVRIR